MGSKPLRIKFNKIDGFIKIYNGIRYLILFGYWWYDKIFDNIKYLASEKRSIDSYNSLPIEKTLTFHNVIILIMSVVNKDINDCYYNIL